MNHRIRSLFTPLAATATLALWQMRQVWRLFLLTGASMVLAVALVCAVPLFGQVAMTSGLRSTFNEDPYTNYVNVSSDIQGISPERLQVATQSLTQDVRRVAGTYYPSEPTYFTNVLDLPVMTSDQQPVEPRIRYIRDVRLELHGHVLSAVAPSVNIVEGRLPVRGTVGHELEIALTPFNAELLNVGVGMVLTTSLATTEQEYRIPLRLKVVGIFEYASPYDISWHGDSLAAEINFYTGTAISHVLLERDDLIASIGHFSTVEKLPEVTNPVFLRWSYRMNTNALDIEKIDEALKQTNYLTTDIPAPLDKVISARSIKLSVSGVTRTLTRYLDRTSVTQVPVVLLAALMLGLLLFFLALMAELLVERQGEALAIIRNRGATLRQIAVAFITQSCWLGLIAILIGPFLALPLVQLLARVLLPADQQSGLNLLSGNPLPIAWRVGWYALVAALVAVLAMVISVLRVLGSSAAYQDGRSGIKAQKPLWQRLYLDVMAVVIASLSYCVVLYLPSTGILDTRMQVLIERPGILMSAVFLLVGLVLILLRFLPSLLRVGMFLTARSRGISPHLPLALMVRIPRPMVRTALLLTLTIALAFFTLIFTATQTQRVQDMADYYAGADFSGLINSSSELAEATPTQQLAAYHRIPGVNAVSVGYVGLYNVLRSSTTVKLMAVDSETFPYATIWSPAQSPEGVEQMMRRLSEQRAALANGTGDAEQVAIPAIVDQACWDRMKLSIGSRFSLKEAMGSIMFEVVGKVDHLPTVNSDLPGTIDRAGVLVDYRSYLNVYTRLEQQARARNITIFEEMPYTNYVWMLTRHDPGTLAGIRQALQSWPLALNGLNDRQGIISVLQNDPLVLTLIGTLAVVAFVPLLLSIIGNIVTSWLSVRSRMTGFAILRALGTTRVQLASLLTWEQGLVYCAAILLGILAGAFLTAITLPHLIFSDVASSQVMSESSVSIFAFQFAPPLRVVVPSSLLIALGVLLGICGLALLMMVLYASLFAPAPVLRLDDAGQTTPPLATAGRVPAERSRPVSVPVYPRPRGGFFPPSLALGLQNMRSSWRSLSLPYLGMLAAMLIVCIIPLFAQVAMTAGMRSMLARPENSYVAATALFNRMVSPLTSTKFTQTAIQQSQELDRLFLHEHSMYFKQPSALSLEVSGDFVSSDYRRQIPDFYSLPSSHASLVHMSVGRFPGIGEGNELEVAISTEMAASQQLKVGDLLFPQTSFVGGPMRIVGLFVVPSEQTREPLPPFLAGIKDGHVMVSSEAVLPVLEHTFSKITRFEIQEQLIITWYYPIESQHLTIDQLEDLADTLNRLEFEFLRIEPIPLQSIATPLAVQHYRDSVLVARISLAATAALILALILLFLGLSSTLLVERQAASIAVLRSRGATRRQILASFLTQGGIIGLLALLVAPLLSIPLTLGLVHLALSATDQQAIELLTGNPFQVIWELRWYLLGAFASTVLALGFSLYRATQQDYQTLRRESARPTRRPLWQRYYLDVVAILVAVVCYSFARYLTNSQVFTPQVNVLVRTPLILAATIFILLAGLLCCLRLLPVLLRLGTLLAARSRSVEPMLALAQVSRAPRRNLQVAMLLICTTAFVLFGTVFAASQEQHSADVASYWAGADFSGVLPRDSQIRQYERDSLEHTYQDIPGVTAAAAGNITSLLHFTEGRARNVRILAVNPTEFFQATLWPQEFQEQGDTHLKALAESSTLSTGGEIIPALVDEATWNALHLSKGATFIMQNPFGVQESLLTFKAIEKLPHIPTLNDRSASANGDYGIVVDYGVYERAMINNGGNLAANFVWLRTGDDPNTVSHVRAELTAGRLRLDALTDRRATQAMLRSDPLTISLTGILMPGMITLIILGLVGSLAAALQGTRERQTHFAMLRALGTTPQHLGRVLGWEQGIIYLISLLLGILLGLLFIVMTLPLFIPPGNLLGTLDRQGAAHEESIQSITDVFTLQNVPPIATVVPPVVGPILLLLLVLGLLTVVIVRRRASRSQVHEMLRLNED